MKTLQFYSFFGKAAIRFISSYAFFSNSSLSAFVLIYFSPFFCIATIFGISYTKWLFSFFWINIENI